MLAVDLRNLTKRFGPVTAVNDLTLQIESGEIVAFLGPNGAGKTTTIDMLLGLSRPDAGSVRVYGTTPEDAVARGEVSAVMQNSGLPERGIVQVSMNLTHFEQTSLKRAFETVREEAERLGATVLESEIVGLVPQAALPPAPRQTLQLAGFRGDQILEQRLNEPR